MTATVSVRGQLVIPAPLRKKYGIEPHSRVELLDLGDELVLVPIPREAFKASRGAFQGVKVQDVLALRRAERLREQREGS